MDISNPNIVEEVLDFLTWWYDMDTSNVHINCGSLIVLYTTEVKSKFLIVKIVYYHF